MKTRVRTAIPLAPVFALAVVVSACSSGDGGTSPDASPGDPPGASAEAPGTSPGASADAPDAPEASPGESPDAPGTPGTSPGESVDEPGTSDAPPGASADAPDASPGESPGASDTPETSPGESVDEPGAPDPPPDGVAGTPGDETPDGGAPDAETPAGLIGANTGLPGATRGGIAIAARRPALVHLDYLTGENGYGLRLERGEGEWSRTFTGLGDVDGDGTDDLAAGTNLHTYVLRGGARPAAAPDLETLVAERGAVLDSGPALVALGDVDGDGVGDVAWRTYDAARDATGVRVIFGRTDGGALAALVSSSTDAAAGFDLVNGVRPHDVRTVAAAGDVDGDGLADILVGSFAYNGEDYDAPNAWIVYGDAEGFPPVLDLARLEPGRGLALASPPSEAQRAAIYDVIGTGYDARVAGGFDFDGDGLDDVAIGASAFDWIGQHDVLRTYVVFGDVARERGRLDMTTLDGVDGLIIEWDDPSFGGDVDAVASLGDVDGDGLDDLAVIDAVGSGGTGHVVFGGAQRFGSPLERTALPNEAGFAVVDPTYRLRALRRVGDIDDDGLDDIGIEYPGGAAILYGDGGTGSEVDLASPREGTVTVLVGGDDGELVALGDVDGDGVDDLGIGWTERRYDPDIRDAGDLDGDGIEDVEIVGWDVATVSLARVLYGFGSEGFDGVLPDPDGPRPLQRIGEARYAELLAALELAARVPLDYLDAVRASGEALGPTASACLEDVDAGAAVTRFECPEAPLSFTFDWGGRRFSGTAGGRYAYVEVDAEGLRRIDFRSFPEAGPAPNDNPYPARFTFERGGELTLVGDESAAPEAPAEPPSCAIDTATRLATSVGRGRAVGEVCAWLIARHLRSLSAIFGPDRWVGELRFEEEA